MFSDRILRKIPLVPNAITAFGLSCGLFVIFKVNMVDPGEGTYAGALITVGLLALAAVADVLDGAVARAMKQESDFGGFFDSLADAVSFGVAPSVVVMKALSISPENNLSFLVIISAMIYSLCGILRLVRFSVIDSQQEEKATSLEIANKSSFTGLPIPAAAAVVVSTNLLLLDPKFKNIFEFSDDLRAVTLSLVMMLIGFFMISRWKFPSLKTAQVRVESFQLVLFVGIFAVTIFYGLLYYLSVVLAFTAWSYVLIGWLLSLYRIVAGRRSKTLEDFEPEPPPKDQ